MHRQISGTKHAAYQYRQLPWLLCRAHGFLRGGYGLDENGNRVLFGKYIDRNGHFRGLLVGTWEPAVEGTNLAEFSGRWTTLCDDQAEDEVN